jgi:hypothetical protein
MTERDSGKGRQTGVKILGGRQFLNFMVIIILTGWEEGGGS